MLVQEARPVLHAGPVALEDRSAQAHVVDPLLVREGLGDVVANGLASAVGRAERGGAVHAVLGVRGDDRLDVMGLPGGRPGRRPPACRRLGVHLRLLLIRAVVSGARRPSSIRPTTVSAVRPLVPLAVANRVSAVLATPQQRWARPYALASRTSPSRSTRTTPENPVPAATRSTGPRGHPCRGA
jgi:hypothetical protein